jgi:hypothetical protein
MPRAYFSNETNKFWRCFDNFSVPDRKPLLRGRATRTLAEFFKEHYIIHEQLVEEHDEQSV